MYKYCTGILSLIDDYILKNCNDKENEAFFLKMKGDYYRYLAQVNDDNIGLRESQRKKALLNYEQGLTLVEEHLEATDPLRLGCALNFSVFCHDHLNQTEKAFKIAHKFFTDALDNKAKLPENTFKESTMLMLLLQDNVKKWTELLIHDKQEKLEG